MFTEGDVFRITVPLPEAAMVRFCGVEFNGVEKKLETNEGGLKTYEGGLKTYEGGLKTND